MTLQPGPGYQFTNERSTPADEDAKTRWAAFEKFEAARRRYDAARKALESARHSLNVAECDVSNATRALERERAEFDKLTKLHEEDARRIARERESGAAAG